MSMVQRRRDQRAAHAAALNPEHQLVEWAVTAMSQAGLHESLHVRDYKLLMHLGLSSRDAAASVREALEAAGAAYRAQLARSSSIRASDTAHPDTGRIARPRT
jgi:hypothetical protein